MAEDKKSFVAYTDWNAIFKKLTNEEAGKLSKMIFSFVSDENPEAPDRITELLFEPIKQHLKRDLKKYEHIKQKRIEAGRSGGLKSGEVRSKSINIEANEANASKTQANEAVNVNVNGNENVIKEEKISVNENSIISKMIKIFKKQNKFYPDDQVKDSGAVLQIAMKIGKSKNLEQKEIVNGKMNIVLSEWESVVEFISTDKWFSTRALFDINNEWQRVIQSKSSTKIKSETTKRKNQNELM